MSKKYLEDNKKPSAISRMAPAMISVGSIAAAVVITAPGLADSLAFTETLENDSQLDAISPQATDLPAIAEPTAEPQAANNTTDSMATGADAPASVEPLNSTATLEPVTPIEQVVSEPSVLPDTNVVDSVVTVPVPVDQPAANNSSATWVDEGSSAESVIDQQNPVETPVGNNSSATPYYEDDDHDDDEYEDYESEDDHDDEEDDHDDHEEDDHDDD